VFVRFVLAIVTFVVAAALIGVGIAQRTVWAAPSRLVASTALTGHAAFAVIDGAVLNAHPGQQTLLVSGAKKSFVAYGRTADVKAWLGDEPYSRITYKAATNSLGSHLVTAKSGTGADSTATPAPTKTPGTSQTPSSTPTPSAGDQKDATGTASKKAGPNPIGSDLWLEQFVGEDSAITKMNVPDSISVIIASDGTAPAPNSIELVWPLDDSTPWSGPLIVGGGILLIVGLILYLFALRGMRRARGPRRTGGPKMPKLPKSPRYKPTGALESGKGRRSIRRRVVVVPAVIIGSLLFSGCSAEYWPDFGAKPTPSATVTPLATDLPGQGKEEPSPAVTGPQLDDIVTRIATLATQADSKLDTDLISKRFTGPALDARTANYAIRSKKTDASALQPLPSDFTMVVALPQATDAWPRVVSAVVRDKTNEKSAPLDLVMTQETPRDNYHVEYAISLQADAKVPDLAPVNIGASAVPPNSKLLRISPEKLGEAYSDVLLNGAKSKYASMFDEKTDGLSKQVGADYKAKQIADLPTTASLAYTAGKASGQPVAMATNQSGALVATSVTETATVKPVEDGAKVGAGSVTAAMTGVDESTTGLATTYGYQLLFYVPPADSKEKIRLLGFSQAPISAKEL
jgi:hypothetical protein